MPGACITAQVIKQRQGHVHPVYRYVGPGRAGSIPFVRDRAHACISVSGTGKGAYEIVTTEQPGSRDDLAGCGRAGWSRRCCRVSCHGQDGLVGVAWGDATGRTRCDGTAGWEEGRGGWLWSLCVWPVWSCWRRKGEGERRMEKATVSHSESTTERKKKDPPRDWVPGQGWYRRGTVRGW